VDESHPQTALLLSVHPFGTLENKSTVSGRTSEERFSSGTSARFVARLHEEIGDYPLIEESKKEKQKKARCVSEEMCGGWECKRKHKERVSLTG